MTSERRIHPTAVIASDAELADDVRVGPFAMIGPKVQIGAGSEIGAHTVVKGPSVLGRNNRIYPFASIGDDPQDKKYAGEETWLEIGDNNTFREYCLVNRGTTHDAGVTRIGSNCLFMAYSHVAHDCQLGDEIIFTNNASLAGHVHIGDWAILSGFVAVHQFCRIGAHAFIGAYAGIRQDVLPYVMIIGNDAVPRGINSEGLKRRGFTAEQIRNLKDAYRLIFRSGARLAEAQERLREQAVERPELRIMVEFLEQSERGILR